MKLQGIDFRGLAMLAAVAGVAYVAYRVTKAAPAAVDAVKQAATDAVQLVNPADSGNVVNRGVSAVGAAVSGDSTWSLGGWLAELFDPGTKAANAMINSPPTWSGRVGYHDPVYEP